MVVEAKAEAVRAMAAPHSQTVEIAFEAGVLDAAGRQVWKDFRRPERLAAGFGIGLVGVGNGRACIKTPDCGRYTLVYSFFSPSKMPSRARSVKAAGGFELCPFRNGLEPSCKASCSDGTDVNVPWVDSDGGGFELRD